MVYGAVKAIKKILLYVYYKFLFFNKHIVFKGIPSLDKKVYFEGYNAIYPGASIKSSYIGLGTYVGNDSSIFFTKIGNFCTIADNVRTSLGLHPSQTFVSIHPAFFSNKKQSGFTFVKRQKFEEHKSVSRSKYFVEIGNDVWVGNNVLIMDGVKIGDGAIVAAGSVVTKNVEPYSIVGGIPAKVIKWRFNQEQIQTLTKIEWWNKDIEWLKENAEIFDNIDNFIDNQSNLLHSKTVS